MYNNNYFSNNNNNNLNKRINIIFLITILSFGAITNIFSISSSSSSNFIFLKDAQALETTGYVIEYEKEKQKENNYYKDPNFDDNSRYLSTTSISSESDLSPTSLDLDRKNNYYYNNNHHQYKSIAANIEKEIIKCNNFNLNLNGNGEGLTTNGNNNDNENNNNIVGQIFAQNQDEDKEEEETATINANDNNKPSISRYDSKDSKICSNL